MEFYQGEKEYSHQQSERIGILLVNLGTPDAPTASALKPYLKKFLSDPRVIELPRWRWQLILNLFILPIRSRKSAELYKKVWRKDGSPLLIYTTRQVAAISEKLKDQKSLIVDFGMRIGNPSLKDALDRLFKQQISRLLVIPLFPQYSGTTTASVFDGLSEELQERRWVPELRFVNGYHDHPLYIKALANSVREVWNRGGRAERLLMSFHGIPLRYFQGGDPYHCFCRKTARLLAEELRLKDTDYLVSFQSLFGKEEWLRPYTNEVLIDWAKSGISSVDIISPGFSADCLETLEELEEQAKEVFLHAGGKQFRYVPALNDREDFIELLLELIRTNTQGWENSRLHAEVCEREFSALSKNKPYLLSNNS